MCTAAEAAEMLRVAVETVQRYVREGRLRARKVGRQYLIPLQEVEALLAVQPRGEAEA